MKLSDYKGEKAIEVFADLLEPIANILSDPEMKAMFENENASKIDLVKGVLKKHSAAVCDILKILNPEEEINLLTLPATLIEIFNDKAFVDLFTSQSQDGMNAFGSAMENTEVSET